ncbi:MAG: sugar ABC transporter permease [Anaerolineae bacterium]|nr:sugar ABC transporter permease [Anaerolineae bacterium]
MSMKLRINVLPFMVLLPSLILMAVFVYGFIGWTGYTSATDSNALQQLSGQPARYVGLKNYEDLFTGRLNARFRIDLVNIFFFTVLFILVSQIIGFGLAVLLDQNVKGEGIFRSIFLFPMALSFVVTGTVWQWLFSPNSGLNTLVTYLGLPQWKIRWFISEAQLLEFQWNDLAGILIKILLGIVIFAALLYWSRWRSQTAAVLTGIAILLISLLTFSDLDQLTALEFEENHGFNLALIAVVIAASWQMSGYIMAMYLAGIRGIPDELREAARVDGARELHIYRHIIVPLLRPITLSAVIVQGHISLKIFDLVFTLGGGDNLFIDMPGINMFFVTFRGNDFARGAAIAIIMLIMIAFVIVPYLVISLRGEVE